MLPTTIRSSPVVADYTPLEEYTSQTPASFVDGKPVLHYHVKGAKAWVPKSQASNLAVFPADASSSEAHEGNGAGSDTVEQIVDVFVGSDNFTIFGTQSEAGVSIPYPSISIHAVKQVSSEGSVTQAVWMQLEFAEGGADDDDFNTIELTIVPPATDATPSAASQLYDAMSRCSDLHPDPNDEGDEEEEFDGIIIEGSAEYEALEGFPGVMRGPSDSGLPPPMAGSGGWITAENVHEFFDEDGNWLGRGDDAEEELGEGAGRVRARDEVEGAVNGHGSADDTENKRPRVD